MCQGGKASNEKPTRKLKNALTAGIGASLFAVSATLLARSNEAGEWLQSVAPNVMPRAEAGAEILQKAIKMSKNCIRAGVNGCLDAEGKATALYTYLSQWYLSPRQHVVEGALSILFLTPLAYIFFRACRARVRLQRATHNFGLRESPPLMKLWAASLITLVLIGAFLKFKEHDIISHPAYLWQPCHGHSIIMAVCTFVGTEWATLAFHVASTLWWGPLLALISPDLPAADLEIVIFWVQHSLMLLVPFFRLKRGAEWMYRDFWWNAVGFLLLTCYHWWLIAPVNIITGVNVATMSVPPASLAVFGKYYRVLWAVLCIALQTLAVAAICLLAYLTGRWPVRRRGDVFSTCTSPAKATRTLTRPLPEDATEISTEAAVRLVDG